MKTCVALLALVAACSAFPFPEAPVAPAPVPVPHPPAQPAAPIPSDPKVSSELKTSETAYLASPYGALLPTYGSYGSYGLAGLPNAYSAYSSHLAYPAISPIHSSLPTYSYYLR